MRHSPACTDQTQLPVPPETIGTPHAAACNDSPSDTAVIRVDQLRALAGLLSLEEVAEQFSDLSTVAQVSIFGLFEDALAEIRTELTQTAA